MLPFLHDRVQRLNVILEACSRSLADVSGGAAPSASEVGTLLADAAHTYGTLGMSGPENEVLALSAELSSLRRGVTPAGFEASVKQRREATGAVALRTLLHLAERLRNDIDSDKQQLASSRQEVAGLVLYGLQQGVLSQPFLEVDLGAYASRAWKLLRETPETRSATKQVQAVISVHDVTLLVVDVLTAIGDQD